MSDDNNRSPRRSGGRVNRNGGNRNGGGKRQGGPRNNDGRKRNNKNREGGGGNRRQGGGGGRGRAPLPKLTFWERLLTFLGVYDPRLGKRNKKGKPAAKKSSRRGGKDAPAAKKEARTGDRREKINIGDPVRKDREPRERRNPGTKKLHIKNLSYDAGESDLEELFKGIGSVRNVEVVYDKDTHRSKGFAFLTMSKEEEAQRAIDVLHDQFFLGRKLTVQFAADRPAKPADDAPAETPAAEPEAKPTEEA